MPLNSIGSVKLLESDPTAVLAVNGFTSLGVTVSVTSIPGDTPRTAGGVCGVGDGDGLGVGVGEGGGVGVGVGVGVGLGVAVGEGVGTAVGETGIALAPVAMSKLAITVLTAIGVYK